MNHSLVLILSSKRSSLIISFGLAINTNVLYDCSIGVNRIAIIHLLHRKLLPLTLGEDRIAPIKEAL